MPAPDAALTGDALLVAVTDSMVELHQRYHHRAPVTAKTTMLGDDLLACVLGGVYTDVEKTMIELQRTTIVQETRSAFQNAMQRKFIDAVQRLSGRGVLAFISNHHVGTDMEIELFLLQPEPAETVAAEARPLPVAPITATYDRRMQLGAWIEAYGRAWETGDEDLIVSLFTDDASYRSSPFREPFRGHDEIRAYWRRNAGTQRNKRIRMGLPFVDGDRVAVEWWTTMVDDGATVTLPGCLLLRFEADGRCRDLREYWHVEPGTHNPFPGWGT